MVASQHFILFAACVLLACSFHSAQSEVAVSSNNLYSIMSSIAAKGGGASTRASHGDSCMTDPCVVTNALECDQATARCRCLNAANFNNLVIEGHSVNMQWKASAGRCLSQPNALCATEPVTFTDQTGQQHRVPINCDGLQCEFLVEYQGMKAGYCKPGTSGSGGATVVVGIATLLMAAIAKVVL